MPFLVVEIWELRLKRRNCYDGQINLKIILFFFLHDGFTKEQFFHILFKTLIGLASLVAKLKEVAKLKKELGILVSIRGKTRQLHQIFFSSNFQLFLI